MDLDVDFFFFACSLCLGVAGKPRQRNIFPLQELPHDEGGTSSWPIRGFEPSMRFLRVLIQVLIETRKQLVRNAVFYPKFLLPTMTHILDSSSFSNVVVLKIFVHHCPHRCQALRPREYLHSAGSQRSGAAGDLFVCRRQQMARHLAVAHADSLQSGCRGEHCAIH